MKKEISFEKNYLTVADIKSYLCISSTAAYELTPPQGLPGLPAGELHPHPHSAISGLGGQAHPHTGRPAFHR